MRNAGPQAPDPLAASARTPWGQLLGGLRLPFRGQRKEENSSRGKDKGMEDDGWR